MRYFVVMYSDGVFGSKALKITDNVFYYEFRGINGQLFWNCNLKTGEVLIKKYVSKDDMLMLDVNPNHVVGGLNYVDNEKEMKRQLIFNVFEWKNYEI